MYILLTATLSPLPHKVIMVVFVMDYVKVATVYHRQGCMDPEIIEGGGMHMKYIHFRPQVLDLYCIDCRSLALVHK
jgi:hypothetical protein